MLTSVETPAPSRPAKPHDLAGSRREAEVARVRRRRAPRHLSSSGGPAAARRQRRREQVVVAGADHRVDHFGDGQPGAVAGPDVLAVAGDGDAVGDREHLLEAMRDIKHRRAATAQLPQHREQPLASRARSRPSSARRGSSRRGCSSSTRASSTSCCSPMESRPTGASTSTSRPSRSSISRLSSRIARVDTRPRRFGSRLTKRLASTERCGNSDSS